MNKETYDELISSLRLEIKELENFSSTTSNELKRLSSENIALRKNEEKIYSMLENSPEAFQSLDVDGNILNVNKKWCEELSYKKKEVIGRAFDDFLVPESKNKYLENFPKFKENGHTSAVEFEMLKKNGEKISVSYDGVILYDDKGQMLQTSCVFTNITQQKILQDALEKSEEKFRELYNHSPDMYVSVSPKDSTVVLCNNTFLEKTNYIREEVVGSPVFNLYHEDSLVDAEKAFQQFVNTGRVVDFPLILKKKDGSKLPVDLNVNSVRDEEGKILYSISSWRDMTELHSLEHRYYDLLESMKIGIVIHRPDTSISYMNPFASKHLSQSKDTAVDSVASDSRWKFLNGDTSPMEIEDYPINKILSAHSELHDMILGIRSSKESDITWALVSGYPVYDLDNNLVEVVITFSDITEPKQKEEKVKESENKFKGIFEQAAVGAARVSLDGKWLEVNKKLCEIVGYSKKELLTKTFQEITHPDDLKADLSKVHQLINNEIDTYSMNKRYFNKDGSIVWVNLTVSLMRKIENSPDYFISIIEDITQKKKVENALVKEKARYEKAERIAQLGSWEQNILDDTLQWSDEVYRIFEIDISKEMTFDDFAQRLHPEDRESVFEAFQTSVKEHKSYHIVHRLLFSDGRIKYVLEDAQHFYDSSDNHISTIGTVQDITDLKESESRLRQSATVFENTTEGVMITDTNSVIIDVNEAFSQITGREHEEVLGIKASILKSGRHNKKFYKEMWKSISQVGSWRGEIWNRRKDGEIYPQWLNISSVKNTSGVVESYIAVFSDITSLKETEMQLDFLAHHDHLTELPNRVLLNARLKHTLSTAKRDETMTAVMFMDIDNFKNINDSYGHTFGDELLIALSKRLKILIREDDTFSRIGGDEFVIVMSHFINLEEITHISQKIMQQLEEPFSIEEKEFWISVSIGISVAPNDGNSSEILIKNADTAMYEAKEHGKNTVKFYNDEMSANSFERVVFESALKAGINNNEFEVYYQPQENLQDNSIIGFEALVRWNHPTLGLVPPDKFISIAEETKMILDIGEFVLETSCKDIKKWHDEGLCKGRVAVNVSGIQLEHSEFAEILKHNLKKHHIDPSMIEIEVTESMVMKNPDRWISILEEIHRIGVSISIDDFGTGYSSLSYLRRLPVDTLKIDQSFIQDIPQEKDACAIVEAIINMADSLGLNTLAEGIETSEQREYLVEKSCTHGQGYLLSRPMTSKNTYNWLKERNLEI